MTAPFGASGDTVATLKLTNQNFAETIEKNDIVVIDFWAQWCGPCRSFAPTFEAASEKHTDVVFAKVNTDEEGELASEFGVRSIPTITLMREQVVLFSQPGVLSAGQLDQVIAKARSLDMNEVREALAKEAAEGSG